RQERSLNPRPGNASDHWPRLANPAEIRQRRLLAQDLQKPIAHGVKKLNVLMRVDHGRRPANQVTEPLQLGSQLGFDFVGSNTSGECPAPQSAHWPLATVG